MKIVRRGALPVGSESGLSTIRDRALRGDWRDAARGTVEPRTSGTGSSRRCSRSSTSTRSAPLRVVIDAANGMAGAMLPPVLERLPQVDAVRCYFEPDGSFPNHEPNPLLPENREFIVARPARPAPTSASPTTATPTAASSSTTPASSCPATSSPRCFAESILAKEPGGEGHLRRARVAGPCREAIEAAGGVAAHQPRRPRVHQAADARGRRRVRRRGLGALLLPRLLPGRLGRRPVPAHARAASRSAGRS